MTGKYGPRVKHPQELQVLRDLREAQQVTQAAAAKFFYLGKSGRDTIRDWENGEIIPEPWRRAKFIDYLWEFLKGKADTDQFTRCWNVLCQEWHWPPLTTGEWQKCSGTLAKGRGVDSAAPAASEEAPPAARQPGAVQAEADLVDDGTVHRDKNFGTQFIEEELPRIVSRQQKEHGTFAVVFVDVDDLTKINKHYGSDVGDVVLDTVLELIRRRSAAHYKGRCGDDTFYAVLFDTAKVDDFCEGLKRDVQHHPWQRTVRGLHVTCTMGHAVLKPGEHPYEWLARSIHGMLEGKRQGGNTVQPGPLFYTSPVPVRKSPRVGYWEEDTLPSERFRLRNYVS